MTSTFFPLFESPDERFASVCNDFYDLNNKNQMNSCLMTFYTWRKSHRQKIEWKIEDYEQDSTEHNLQDLVHFLSVLAQTRQDFQCTKK